MNRRILAGALLVLTLVAGSRLLASPEEAPAATAAPAARPIAAATPVDTPDDTRPDTDPNTHVQPDPDLPEGVHPRHARFYTHFEEQLTALEFEGAFTPEEAAALRAIRDDGFSRGLDLRRAYEAGDVGFVTAAMNGWALRRSVRDEVEAAVGPDRARQLGERLHATRPRPFRRFLSSLTGGGS